MVFTTSVLWRKIVSGQPSRGPDRYWKKRRILRMAAHFVGRKQNCYTIAMNAVRRALRFATLARTRDLKYKDNSELYVARLSAACEQHGFKYSFLRESLIRSNILLDKRILTDLAVWEPRTFKCLTEFAWNKAKKEGLNGIDALGDPPAGVILKPMIVK